MSGDSEVPNLKPQNSENAVSENSGETEKKLKRNYCYVCEVQCTAVKNFLEHQKGKKHLKKCQIKEANKKKKQAQNSKKSKNTPIKRNLQSSSCPKSHEQNPEKSESHEISNSHSGVDNSTDTAMNNSKRQPPKYKKNQYNSSHQNNYSRYQNSRYSYANRYDENREYCYNEQPSNTYTRWRAPHYSNAHPVHNNFNNYEFAQNNQYYAGPRYNVPYKNEYFSHGYVDQDQLPFSSAEPENSVYNFFRNEISEIQEFESNSLTSGNTNKGTSKDKSNSTSILEAFNLGQNTSLVNDLNHSQSSSSVNDLNQSQSAIAVTDLNQSSVSIVEVNDSANSTPTNSPISTSSKSKVGERKRLRTRSLSSSESLNNDKKSKDKTESLSLDSDGTSDEQKLKEYTTSLLETNPNRISRMIQHPSNYKEKAVLNHIMTSFSKTKRKESLTRKLRSNSLGSAGNNDDVTLEVQSVMSENEEVSFILPSEVISAQARSDSDQNKCTPVVKKSRNNSRESTFDPVINNEDSNNARSPKIVAYILTSKKPSKESSKSKESIISTTKHKAPVKRKQKSSESESLETAVKRKDLDSDANNKSKKQKSIEVRNCEIPCMTEQDHLNKDRTPSESSLNKSSNIQINPTSLPEVSPVKEEEVAGCTGMNQAVSAVETSESTQNQLLDSNLQFSVETLIELFASGNVAVKREFNDPVIDAIKGVDPNELFNACSNDSRLNNIAETTHTASESNVRGSKLSTTEPNLSVQENINRNDPVILGSTVDSDNIRTASVVQRNSSCVSNPSSAEKSKDQSSSSKSDATGKNSLSEIEKLNLISRTKSEFPHLSDMIEKLQEIALQEETVKQNIVEAKCKIHEYSNLLEEWKNKKKKLHNEEEELRKKRNDIIQLMQNAVKIPSDTSDTKIPSDTSTHNDTKTPSDTSSKESKTKFARDGHSTPGKGKTGKTQPVTNKEKVVQSSTDDTSDSSTSSSSPEMCSKRKKPNSPESDDIVILPSPVKPKPPEIVIVDDTEESTTGTQSNNSRTEKNATSARNRGSSLYDTKNLTAHSTVVNCIVVFDNFLYTCSNDSTARRFSLKDTSQTVVYYHSNKNVTEVTVEKVQNEALVFTSCSNRVLSLFIASNGTKIKTFFQSSNIMSICKGWGKFYAALGDGTVNVYNWKYEEKEVVKAHNPACRIATTDQGRLHILIVLTSDGHVALRDAETNLLIRCIKASVRIPSWLTVYNDFAYLSSSDRNIYILDTLSGRVERKVYISSHATGLAVYDDHIFTIAYNGLICCINKDKVTDKRLFFGAGKNSLTCIHVFKDWVLTGNRKGEISLFKFDPYSRFFCKFSNCTSIFGSREDLEFHVEKDHILKKKNLTRCHWEKCSLMFTPAFSMKDKINHTKKHIPSVSTESAL